MMGKTAVIIVSVFVIANLLAVTSVSGSTSPPHNSVLLSSTDDDADSIISHRQLLETSMTNSLEAAGLACTEELGKKCPEAANIVSVGSDSSMRISGGIIYAASISEDDHAAICNNNDCKASFEKFARCYYKDYAVYILEANAIRSDMSTSALEEAKNRAAESLVICKCDYSNSDDNDDCLSKEAESLVAASAGASSLYLCVCVCVCVSHCRNAICRSCSLRMYAFLDMSKCSLSHTRTINDINYVRMLYNPFNNLCSDIILWSD
jgi:hypothetical protein